MSDTDQETIESIKEWWAENGRFVILGVVIGLGGLIGWQQWHAWQDRTAEGASRVYAAMVDALDARRRNEAAELAQRLQDDFARTAYADQAALLMAHLHMERSEPEAAAEQLRRVVDGSRDRELRNVARLRLARVLHHTGDLDGALATLEQVRGDAFAARQLEIRGDILIDADDVDGARRAYEAALSHPQRDLIDVNLVRIKLNELPGGGSAS